MIDLTWQGLKIQRISRLDLALFDLLIIYVSNLEPFEVKAYIIKMLFIR